ncbi:MAG: iron-containing alcohol dehydrogenase [Anaerolineaceae bacterium]|nr:iron-containing alcohol dehydrogenase [Anaerolineaceae bacterium]
MGSVFYFPTRLIFSTDAAEDLVQELSNISSPKVALLTDQGILSTGMADSFVKKLDAAGVPAEVFSNIPGNPNIQDVLPAFETAQKAGSTHIVALGGGSVIDTAKAVGILLGNPGLDWEDLQWGRSKIEKPALPVIAIPTTAGTGSESTHVTVIGDHTGFKRGVVHPEVFAKIAILDGSLTLSLPAKLTASTGMDVLVHSIEAYLGKRANPMTDMFALGAIRAAVRWLPEATHNGKNLEARKAMTEAATIGGIAMDQAGLGLAHAIAGPVANTYHLHHGLTVAVLLPPTLAFGAPSITPERWQPLREALRLPENSQPKDFSPWATKFVAGLGLPTRLSEVGLQKADIPTLAENTTRMAMFGNNVRQATAEDCVKLLEEYL